MSIDLTTTKLIDRRDLEKWDRNRTEPLIWTNGCFDIIHTGHIHYLHECKKLGGQLIVGLNSDDSVRRLKGPGRPIIGLEDRIVHLSAFFFVDYVVVFDTDTPLEMIKLIRPDILVKGGDYKVEEIVGYEEVTNYGGQVLTIPLVPGKSTTSIIEKIKTNDG